MKRREFIFGFSSASAATALPVAAGAQSVKRVGWLTQSSENDRELEAIYAEFPRELAKLGWTIGRNLQIETRRAGGNVERLRANASELVGKSPDVIACPSTATTTILKGLTSTIPIVFANVADPVASGFVASFARPGRNITGFTSLEYSLAGKWLSILKAIAPNTGRVMVLFNPVNSNWTGYLPTIETGAKSLGISVSPVRVAGLRDIEQAIEAFAPDPKDRMTDGVNGGMIVLPALTSAFREEIAALAVRRRLPAIYPYDYYATSGGLVSYGSDTRDIYRRAAGYVDRILKGERPGDLPVQAPVKFELVINLKAAKAIDLEVPYSLRLLADRVIE